MTRDDIIRLALEANILAPVDLLESNQWRQDTIRELERFAALIAAHTLSNIDPSKLMSYQEGFEATAAELRRLHAELERCKQVCAVTAEEWRTDAEEWKAQRDALLEALHSISLASQDSGSTREGMGLYARAAIAKCEENT